MRRPSCSHSTPGPEVASALSDCENISMTKENSGRRSREMAVFEAFFDKLRPLFMTEISESTGMPISTCFSVIDKLRNDGFMYTPGARKGFYPTAKLANIASVITAHDPLQRNVAPHLETLRDKTQETVLFAQRIGAHAIMLLVRESPLNIRYVASVGRIIPVHSSSIGRSILARMPSAQRSSIIEASIQSMPGETRTVGEIDAIVEHEEERGWHIGKGETDPDLCGVSRAVDIHGQIFAVTVAGPVHRMMLSLDSHVFALNETCQALETSAGDGNPITQADEAGKISPL
jgi:IclR family transcriptional regulator, acetate operon repressor